MVALKQSRLKSFEEKLSDDLMKDHDEHSNVTMHL